MHSCLYVGHVRHRRFEPVEHEFRYPIAYLYADLAELESLIARLPLLSNRRRAVASICREDHLGDPARPWREAVLEKLQCEVPTLTAVGSIRLLTLWRSWGTYFSPVNFYYCFDAADQEVVAMVAEVSNTPWNERHEYVLTNANRSAANGRGYENLKTFHVSPFLDVGLQYRWQLSDPSTALSLHLEARRDDRVLLDATLSMRRRELTGANWLWTLAQFPWLPARVLPKIYWQALRLWIKKVPFYPHPRHRSPLDDSTTPRSRPAVSEDASISVPR